MLLRSVCAWCVHSPGGTTLLCEMTSWPPSWNYDIIILEICQSMRIYLKNWSNLATWSDLKRQSLWQSHHQEEEEEEQRWVDISSICDQFLIQKYEINLSLFSELYHQLASLERHALLTRCFSAVAELLVNFHTTTVDNFPVIIYVNDHCTRIDDVM